MKALASDGQIWVCGACGKHNKDPMQVGDSSCYMWSTLCDESSLVLENGLVVKATASKQGAE